MSETTNSSELGALYDWLSRFNLLINLRRFGRLDADLTVHKSLRVPEALNGTYTGAAAPLFINDRALEAGALKPEPRVLDAGCGFGGTVFRWQELAGGVYDGLTLSRVQRRFAQRVARRRRLSSVCRFHLCSYDQPPTGPYDAVVSIESLVHSPDIEVTIGSLAAVLEPGGKLILVEDVPRDEAIGDRDLEILGRYWRLEGRASDSALEAALATHRLRLVHEEDFSDLVQTQDDEKLRQLEQRYSKAWSRVPVTGVRFILEAFIGGLALERLYRRGLVRYRLLVARKE